MNDRPFLVTVDLEPEWESGSCRAVDDHLPWLLDLFAARGVRATFFCTAEVARARPALLQGLAGPHELASHGVTHRPLTSLTPAELDEELVASKAAIEALGSPCQGFRAPYFTMTPPILAAVARAGYAYDSSWASVALHIGYRNLLRAKRPVRLDPPGIVELPVPDVTPARVPFGLSYLRLFHPLSRAFLRDDPYLLYLHCDEFLPVGPGQGAIPAWARPLFARRRGPAARAILEQVLDALAARGARFVTCAEFVRDTPLPTRAR